MRGMYAECMNMICYTIDSPIAFEERVTFVLQRTHASLLHCLRVRLHNGYMQAYAQIK